MHWSQSRLNFDAEKLYSLGVRHIYALPGYSTGEWLCDEQTFSARLEELRRRRIETETKYPDVQVHVMAYTSSHPEGQAQVPSVYQCQIDLDGRRRAAFVCLRDSSYRKVLLERFRQVARAGFRRMLLDDDLKDCQCFCALHVRDFSGFIGTDTTRDELARAFGDTSGSADATELRRLYIEFCRQNLLSLAADIESAVHQISPKLRIGTCLPARCFQDLTGIDCTDILDIFGTPEAASFARLPGEHYAPIPLQMASSVGHHTYYDALLPAECERAWEVTAVSAAPWTPKTSAQLLQEARVSAVLGLNALWAWTEEFDHLRIWPGLLAGQSRIGPTLPRQSDREYLGIPVLVSPRSTHEISLKEHLSDGLIKGYETLALMGLPLRLTSQIRPEDDVICMFGCQPPSASELARRWLDEGRTVVIDLPAARTLAKHLADLMDFSLVEPGAEPHMEVSVANGEIDSVVGRSLIGSVAVVTGDGVTPLTTFRDASGKDLGTGIALAGAGRGKLVILPFDLGKMTFRLSGKFHRDLLLQSVPAFKSGRLPYIEGDAFLHVVLFQEGRQINYVALNYSDYPVEAALGGLDTKERVAIRLEPLGVERGLWRRT